MNHAWHDNAFHNTAILRSQRMSHGEMVDGNPVNKTKDGEISVSDNDDNKIVNGQKGCDNLNCERHRFDRRD